MKKLWKWRHNFMVNNPILASYIAFAKGILITVLIYEFIIKWKDIKKLIITTLAQPRVNK